MKKILLVILCSLWCVAAHAQSCCGNHTEQLYTNVGLQQLVYASNLLTAQGNTVDGSARVWTAQDDTCQRRPLVIFIHGGGFTAGYPDLMDPLCQAFARRGFVAASISYRLGWLGGASCPIDSSETYRAWYRAVQDGRTAVRYFRSQASTLRLDTNLVFVAGWSSGGYAAIGMAYSDLETEKPLNCNAVSSLLVNGNTVSRPDLGGLHDGAHQAHGSQITAVASMASSVLFPQHIAQGAHVPILAFNNTADPYAIPYEACSIWWNYDNCAQFPDACGVGSLTDLFAAEAIEMEQVLYTTAVCGHDLHNPCFPFWEDEVTRLADFFNSHMNCSLITQNQSIGLVNTLQQFTCFTTDAELPDSLKHCRLFTLEGRFVSSGKSVPQTPGIYLAVNQSNRYLILVQQP